MSEKNIISTRINDKLLKILDDFCVENNITRSEYILKSIKNLIKEDLNR